MKKIVYLLFPFLLTLLLAPVFASEETELYDFALKLYQRGDYVKAVDEFTKILTLGFSGGFDSNLNYASVYYNRGLCFKKLLMWEKAADDFSMVIGLFPNDPDAYYQRSGCFAMLGMQKEAKIDLDYACDLDDKYCTEEMLDAKKEKKDKEQWWIK